MKKYETLVLIGRFQPVHLAHMEIIRKATLLCRELIIIVGSANKPRTYKNPWSAQERMLMLQNALDEMPEHDCRIHIECNHDSIYNDNAWAMRIQAIVSKYKCLGTKIGIIGHQKDSSSFYLTMFPQWEFEEVGLIEPLNASDVRDLYFRTSVNMRVVRSMLPQSTTRWLEGWLNSPEVAQIIREREFIAKYRKQFDGLAYPPVFVTVDAVVSCANHVLVIKRKAEPGKGLWAIPGGFLNAATDHSVQSAMIRELKEETGIKVPVPVLIGSIVDSRVFDSIERSERGRTITHAFHIKLEGTELPKVKGMDDAEKAGWVPFADLDSSRFYEDHYEILTSMLGV